MPEKTWSTAFDFPAWLGLDRAMDAPGPRESWHEKLVGRWRLERPTATASLE